MQLKSWYLWLKVWSRYCLVIFATTPTCELIWPCTIVKNISPETIFEWMVLVAFVYMKHKLSLFPYGKSWLPLFSTRKLVKLVNARNIFCQHGSTREILMRKCSSGSGDRNFAISSCTNFRCMVILHEQIKLVITKVC